MPSVIIEKGRDKGRFFPLPEGSFALFGRAEECDVSLDDSLLSRRHFAIEVTSDSCLLVDQNSRNGTYLNGDLTSAARLRYGDEIFAGSTLFSFVSDQEAQEKGGLVGQVIGGCEVKHRLGRGGMGVVYLAKQKSMGREIALKILSARLRLQPRAAERFLEEARAGAQLGHPNVVRVYDFGEERGRLYLAMEYLPGGCLEDLLNHTDRILPAGALQMSLDAAQGLEYAERLGIVHRDIKPDNLLLDEEGNTKVADLGIAIRLGDSSDRQRREIIGTPHYMAPEQATGRGVDHRTDIYALGGTLYRMLSGRSPFTGSTPQELMEKAVEEDPTPLCDFVEGISFGLSRLVGRMMAKDPSRRPQSFTELISKLERCLAVETGESSPAASLGLEAGAYLRHGTERPQQYQGQSALEQMELPRLRILAVDDERGIRQLVSEFVKALGSDCETAPDGPEGLRAFRSSQFDLVITDRDMPGMTGDELALAIRSDSPETPIIMLTGLGMEMRSRGEHPECVDLVVSKPITLKRLKRTLQLVLRSEPA